ncbi:hypothetical protein HGRIS_008028 [Hohenbuehelia grisea]|uniref:Cytochrome P450 n=1 Tax=Hohenbuehelia grisea TaxID=104357 RepID=A0ABR3J6R1_9AGAR
MIVLNSAKAITELLEKRSSNYSDRPYMPMNNGIIGWDWNFGLMRYNDAWRMRRRIFHQYFQQSTVDAHQPVQMKATYGLLRNLLERPERFMDHARLHAGSIILQLTYGYEIQGHDDDYVALAAAAREGYAPRGISSSYLVDFFPSLKFIPEWMPGADFKRKAKKWRYSVLALRDRPYDLYKATATQETPKFPSFVAENLERLSTQNPGAEIDDMIKESAGVAYFSGAETTISVVLSFILAMVMYPSVIKRAQEELDLVVGKHKLPNFSDRPMLPFVEAIFLESLRWNPVAPLGVPHANVADDVYEGYHIPAGSIVVGNIWAFFHNKEHFPEPSVFNPDRFYNKDKEDIPLDPTEFAFGSGRRICPARHLANNTAWIAIATILAAFDIEKAKDSDGAVIEPSGEYTSGHTSRPVAFPCVIKPRSEAHRNLVLSL